MSPDDAVQRLTKKLCLTEEQVKKVTKFYNNHQQELEKEIALARVQSEMEAAASGGGVRTIKMGGNLQAKLDKNIESILTPKQKKGFEKLKLERTLAQPKMMMLKQ
ncbi:MAG: hypothetical protein V1799_16165 [bacterium]